ncbi:MAG TPA: outer membrane beta-barrel protein [Gemmatimonadales bacterium]|nr:outer membrane beta-barrel protein [Gemmatimonadales bacterium]
MAAALLATLAVPAALTAQARSQITPFFASFYAVSSYGSHIAEGTFTANERLSNAPGIGVRLSVAVSRAIGIEGQVVYATVGRDAVPDSGSVVGAFIKGNVVMASGRFTYHPRRSNFRGILGVGYQHRGGDAWDESKFSGFTGKFDHSIVGAVVGFGARANLTPHFAMDLDVEGFLYSSDADQSQTLFKSKFQQDILVTIGIPIGFGGGS